MPEPETSTKPSMKTRPPQCCGKCGYVVRGITSLTCPECGSDLRVVGTVTEGSKGKVVAGCLMPLAYTFLCFIFSVGLFTLLLQFLPTYGNYSLSFSLYPDSDEIDTVEFRSDLLWIETSSSSGYGPNINMNSNWPSTPSSCTIDLGIKSSSTNTIKSEQVSLDFSVATPNPNARFESHFNIDPDTREASWMEASTNKWYFSNGPYSQQTILDFMGTLGADTTKPQVIAEAKELYKLTDGFINGQTQFTMQGFDNGGYGYGGSSNPGPTWALVTYWIVWFVIWIIGLVWLARRGIKRSK